MLNPALPYLRHGKTIGEELPISPPEHADLPSKPPRGAAVPVDVVRCVRATGPGIDGIDRPMALAGLPPFAGQVD